MRMRRRTIATHLARSLAILLLAFWASLATATAGESHEATPDAYAASPQFGVVLLDVNWGRRWKCAGYENAELRQLSFDRVPPPKASDDATADVTLEQPSSLFARPVFTPYALLLEPGTYALSSFQMKVARSVSEIALWGAKRSEMFKDGVPQGGSFDVGPGEVVYIGNFWLDCFQAPQPWRYYTQGAEGFKQHLAQYADKYPFLKLEGARYRLFETTRLGRPYSLPNPQ
jgi:hypothetical protein